MKIGKNCKAGVRGPAGEREKNGLETRQLLSQEKTCRAEARRYMKAKSQSGRGSVEAGGAPEGERANEEKDEQRDRQERGGKQLD